MLTLMIIPFVLGCFTVFQNLINREIATRFGPAYTTWLNAAMLFTAASLAVVIYRYCFQSHALADKTAAFGFSWWFLIPGFLGFCIVFSLPLVMMKLPASQVFVTFVAAQLLMSVICDKLINGIMLNTAQLCGVALSIVSVFLINSAK